MNFRADGPLGAGGRRRDGLDDAFGRADLVGRLGDLETALRVNDDANTGMLAADARDVLRRETLMHRAVTLPQDDAGGDARREDGAQAETHPASAGRGDQAA